MLAAYRSVLALHVALGGVALVAFWIALAARKGSPLHLRAGRTYVGSMAGSAARGVTRNRRARTSCRSCANANDGSAAGGGPRFDSGPTGV